MLHHIVSSPAAAAAAALCPLPQSPCPPPPNTCTHTSAKPQPPTRAQGPNLHAVVYDINGREADEVLPILDALPNLEQYIFCSSAGVYLKSDQMPHREEDAVDFKSRHKVGSWGVGCKRV
jgi:hypothetical protein